VKELYNAVYKILSLSSIDKIFMHMNIFMQNIFTPTVIAA